MPSLFVESPREKAQHRIQQFEAAYPDFATLNDAHQHTLTVRCAAAVKALISARRWSVMSPELTRWRSLGKARAYQRAKRAVKELNEMKSYPVRRASLMPRRPQQYKRSSVRQMAIRSFMQRSKMGRLARR